MGRSIGTLLLSTAAALLWLAPVGSVTGREDGVRDPQGRRDTWTFNEVRHLAFDYRMTAVVEHLNATNQPRTLFGSGRKDTLTLEELLDRTPVSHIRQAIVNVTDSTPLNKKISLAEFAHTANADDTCHLRTCGGDGGLLACVDQCNRKKGLVFRHRPADGACHALCMVAAEPCRRCVPGWKGVPDGWMPTATSEVVRSMKHFAHSHSNTLSRIANVTEVIFACAAAAWIAQLATCLVFAISARTRLKLNKNRLGRRSMARTGVASAIIAHFYQQTPRGSSLRDGKAAGPSSAFHAPAFALHRCHDTFNSTLIVRTASIAGAAAQAPLWVVRHQQLPPHHAAETIASVATIGTATNGSIAAAMFPQRSSTEGWLLGRGCIDYGNGNDLSPALWFPVSQALAQLIVPPRQDFGLAFFVARRQPSEKTAALMERHSKMQISGTSMGQRRSSGSDMVGISRDGDAGRSRACPMEGIPREVENTTEREIDEDTKSPDGPALSSQNASSDRGTVGGVKPRSDTIDDFVLGGGSRVPAAVPSHTAAATATASTVTAANATAAMANAATAHDRIPATSPAVDALGVDAAVTEAVPPSLPSPLILYGERRAIAMPFLDKIKEVGAESVLTLCSALLGRNPTAHVKYENAMDDEGCGRLYELVTHSTLTPAISTLTDGCGCSIKITKKGGDRTANKAMTAEFLREAKALKRIPLGAHENILPAFDISMNQQSIVVLRSGMNLCRLVKTSPEPLPRAECLRYMQQITSGVRYIHATGMIHGALKLENVLIHRVHERAMISGFGMSGDVGSELSGGSLPYFSAETLALVDSRRARLSVAGDVFALGVMFQQLLSSSPEPVTLPTRSMVCMPYPPGAGGRYLQELDLYIDDLKRVSRTTASAEIKSKLTKAKTLRAYQYERKVAMWLRMGNLESTYLSPCMWPQQTELRFREEVMSVMKALLHRDPVKRLRLETLAVLLSCPTLWEDKTPASSTRDTLTASGSTSGSGGGSFDLNGGTRSSSTEAFAPFSRILKQIVDDARQETLLGERREKPAWMETCDEWWMQYPSLEGLRERRRRDASGR